MWNMIFADMTPDMEHTLGSGATGTGQVVSSGGHVTIDFLANNSSVVNNVSSNLSSAGTFANGTNPFLFLIFGVILVIIVVIVIEKF